MLHQFRCQILFVQITLTHPFLSILGATILLLALFYLVVGYNTCHLAFSLPGSTCCKSLCLQINLPRVKPCSDDSLPQNPSVTFYYLLNNACNSCQFGRIKLSLILESIRFGLRFWLLQLSVLWLWTYCLIFIHSFIQHMFIEHLLRSRLYMKPMRWSDEPNRHCPFLLDLKRIRLVHISHDHSNPKYRPYFTVLMLLASGFCYTENHNSMYYSNLHMCIISQLQCKFTEV